MRGTKARRHEGTKWRNAFTLTEMLTVVVIIALLMGLLIPLVGKMRTRGYATDSAAQIQALRSAIEQYFTDHRAYPGPFSDNQINSTTGLPDGVNGTITGTESLAVALIGGLGPDPTGNNPNGKFAGAFVGQGPKSINPRNPKTYKVYFDNWQSHLMPDWVAADNANKPKFIEEGTGRVPDGDSELPEFVDRFPSEPMPLLYLRARVGAHGILIDSSGHVHQYDLRYVLGYTEKGLYGRVHKLRNQGILRDPNDQTKVIPLNQSGWDAGRYLLNPAFPPTDMSAEDRANETGTPKSKDSFVLISPGLDRLYGTTDDITSFGAVE